MADQAAGPSAASAGAAIDGLRWQPTRAPASAAAVRLPEALVLAWCVLLALASVALQGFRFGVDNNLFHIPIVLRWYDLPQFEGDPFVQSLRRFATPVFPFLSLFTTEGNIQAVFLAAHLLARTLTLYALVQGARALGLRGLWPAAAAAVLCLALPVYRASAIGRDELLPDLFTHTEVAQAVALLAAAWLIRGETTKAALAAGLAFDLNMMVGVWMAAPLGLRLAADAVARPDGRVARILRAGAAFALAAAPEIAWLAATQRFEPPAFDYRAYLVDYYPYHFFIGWAAWPDRLTLALQVLSGLAALWLLPRNRLGAAATLLGLAAVFCLGAVIDQKTHSRLILNLHLLRVDGLILWISALLVATAAAAGLAVPRLAPWPGAVAALAGLVAGWWPLVLVGLLLQIAGRLPTAARGRRSAPLPGGLLLAGVVGAVALAHGGYSTLPPPPRAGEPPSDDQLLGAAPSAPEWLQVTRWARERTPAEALFLAPWKLDFVAAAERRSWVGWKEGATPLWAPETYAQWASRGQAVRALASAGDELAYACAHGIDYVILDKRPGRALAGTALVQDAAFANRWFAVVPARRPGRC